MQHSIQDYNINIFHNHPMSTSRSSRLKQSSVKSFRNQPVEFRNIIHQRTDHQAVLKEQYESQNCIQRYKKEFPVKTTPKQSPIVQSPYQKKWNHRSISSPKSDDEQTQYRYERLRTLNNKGSNYSTIERQQRQTTPLANIKLTSSKNNTERDRVKLQINEIKLQTISKQKEPQNQRYVKSDSKIDTIAEIDNRIANLVAKKLKLVISETKSKSDLSQSVCRLLKQDINNELKQLMEEIHSLKNSQQCNEVTLLNKKIQFIQILLAEQTTEAELMKKYYYNINSNKIRGKVGDFTHKKSRISHAYQSITKFHREHKSLGAQLFSTKKNKAKLLFQGTTNNQAYKEPKLSDYQKYRYKQKNIEINLQPLPRSSYKREFLNLKSLPNEKIVNRDHTPFNPSSKDPINSTYNKDYKTGKGDIINYRDLDAYHNKFKVLKVSYMPKNRLQAIDYDRLAYSRDVQQITSRCKSHSVAKNINSISENQLNFNKHMLKSVAHREFLGEGIFERSHIKHQKLKQLQSKLKNLFKS